MICCRNCGTPIGRVSFCPACGVAQDYPDQDDFEPSAPSQPAQEDPELSAVVVVSARSPSGTKYEMGEVVFGESNAQTSESSIPDVSEIVPQHLSHDDRSTSQVGPTESAFREELRQASSKLPASHARANRPARKVEGAGVQRAIAIVSLIVGAMSFPYGIALVILGWISLRKVQSAIYAATDEEVAANMSTAKTVNIVAICILVVTVIIGLFFVVGVLSEIGALNFGI